MLAIFVEVVHEVLVAVAWVALGTAALGLGLGLVLVGVAVALHDTRREGDWLDHLWSTGRLLLARGPHPAADLATAQAGGDAQGPPVHPAAAGHPPHRVPDPADDTRWTA